MSRLTDLPDNASVIVTIEADRTAAPARPMVNGVEHIIPNNTPTKISVPHARALETGGFRFSVELIDDEPADGVSSPDHEPADPLAEKLVTDEQPEEPLPDTPPALGGGGVGDGAQPQGDVAAVPTTPAAFDPTAVLDGNAPTAIARLEALTVPQLMVTRAAEAAAKNRTTVIAAIDARLKA